jgi:hypothetical protein
VTRASLRRTATALAVAAALAGAGTSGATCAPAASGILPASGIVGTSVVATISGAALAGATVTVYGEPGLAATVQSSSDLALTVRLDLDAVAVLGERILVVETAGGTTGVSFVVNGPGGPVVAGVSPPLVGTLGQSLAVTISGANLAGIDAAAMSVSGVGVTVTSATPSADGTSLDVVFAIDASAETGTHAVTLTTPAGGVVLPLYVQRPPPTVASVRPGAGEVGASVALTLTGTDLTGAALVVTGSGIRVTDTATPDASTLIATLQIDPATAPSSEPRLLIVTTESGQTTAEFFVVAAGVPTVTGVEPGAGEPGVTVPVTLRGLHLTGGMASVPPGPLTLQNVLVVDDETITLDVMIDGGATPGTDHTITVTTADGSAPAVFRVIGVGDPFIGRASPPFGNRGATVTLFVHGVNLGLVVPGTGVDLSGPKIAESNAEAVDDQTVRATVAIDRTASVGYRDVIVNLTNAKSATLTAGFRVNVPGTLPSITDVSPTLVEPGMTTPMQVTGTNFAGGAVLVTGPGAVVSDTVVDASGSLINFNLTLAPDAPAENRAVIVVTENGTARCGIASDPAAPTLRSAKLVKAGARFEVTSLGYRLFLFEFSMSPAFPAGPRTWSVDDADGTLVLDRLDDENVGRAYRQRHRGWVRVRAFTATGRLGASVPEAVRR